MKGSYWSFGRITFIWIFQP